MAEKRTSMQSFGTSSRIGHDSRKFYNRKMYNGIRAPECDDTSEAGVVPQHALGKVHCRSSESMSELPDECVHLVVTSPPYNVGKEYDKDLSLREYENLLRNVFTECQRVLVAGGRVCVNVANVGRKPYIALNALVSNIMTDIGYLMRGEIIWNKSASAGVSCAWGSWQSPSNPVLRDVHEYILCFSKDAYKLVSNGSPTIEKDEFLEATKSIWTFPSESANRVGHPAPFPVELPKRLIKLYSYENDVILDPFMGSGSSAIASVETGRRWVGYDTVAEYCELTANRIQNLELHEPLVS